MNAAPAPIPAPAVPPGDKSWSRPIWILVVLLTCASQLGIIYLLGARSPVSTRKSWPAPPTTLVGDKLSALVDVTDPTLFVLPNRHGFSSVARGMTPRSQFTAPDWNEPFRWLPLSPSQLDQGFKRLLATSMVPPVQVAEKSEPSAAPLATTNIFSLPAQSTLHVEGAIAGRALIAPPKLPSWPNADVLKASEIQVVVDARGHVVSAVLLASSDLAEADQRALDLARAARFEPTTGPADLAWGRLVFTWHTIPLPNADETAAPQPLP